MPSIPLDPTHWTLVGPEANGSQVVTSRGGACFTTSTNPFTQSAPEETSRNTFSPTATEVVLNEAFTLTQPRWFKAFKTSSTELPKETVLELAQPVEQFQSAQIGSGAVTGKNLAADITGPRLIHECYCTVKAATAKTEAGEFYIIPDAIVESIMTSGVISTSKLVKFTEKVVPSLFFFTAANWAIVGKTTTATLVVDFINGKGAAPTYVFGLNQVTLTSETDKITELTYGTAITGSGTTFTTPAGKSILQKTTTGISLTNGASYSVGYTQAADSAAETLSVIHARVYIQNS